MFTEANNRMRKFADEITTQIKEVRLDDLDSKEFAAGGSVSPEKLEENFYEWSRKYFIGKPKVFWRIYPEIENHPKGHTIYFRFGILKGGTWKMK